MKLSIMLIPNYKGGSSHPFDRNSDTYKALAQNNNAAAINQLQKYWGTQPGTDGPHYVGAIVIFPVYSWSYSYKRS